MKNTEKNKKIFPIKAQIMALIVIILLLLILISGFAYAKYIQTIQGSATAQVAKMICTIDVKSSSEDEKGNVIQPIDKTVVNPYCIITVKDYSGESTNPTAITETDVSYKISVEPKKDANGENTFELPEYYWYEISSPESQTATKIATSTALTSNICSDGDFKSGKAETRYYKIVFLNSGEQDITRYVDFNLTATQVQSN